MSETRLIRLHQLMNQYGIDAVALNPGPTLTYLTGLHFHLMERPTVLFIKIGHQPLLILPELEQVKLAGSRIPLQPVPFNDDPSTWPQTFSQALKPLEMEGTKIGVEPVRIRFLELDYLQQAVPSAVIVSADQVLGGLRLHKDADEIADMRCAVNIAERSLLDVLPMIKPGVTEKEIAAELSVQLLRNGSDPELPFQPIVAGGPNSANPHAVPTQRPLQNGDLLVIDWGARANGYCSDITRTFAIGSLDQDLRTIYDAVQQANAAGRAAGKPGVLAGDVDNAARTVIESTGYGVYFTHRTGHGLGLEDHESPYIFAANRQVLSAGMTYTVEPGIYLPGKGGVRIEDDMLVTQNGSESMTDLPRDLKIL